jgi:hypothetical protein
LLSFLTFVFPSYVCVGASFSSRFNSFRLTRLGVILLSISLFSAILFIIGLGLTAATGEPVTQTTTTTQTTSGTVVTGTATGNNGNGKGNGNGNGKGGKTQTGGSVTTEETQKQNEVFGVGIALLVAGVLGIASAVSTAYYFHKKKKRLYLW